ncbi:MAG: MMPL family transporter [Treponema sp.]|nr:MMPL family transporter [Treponema sp.]
MQISKLNKGFGKIGAFQIKNRWLFIIALALITVLGSSGLRKLSLSGSEESWFADWEQVKIDSDHFEDIFGSEDSIMVLVEADDVFAPEVLNAIKRLGERLVAEVPYADEVTSITDLSIPIGNDEGFEIANPFEDGIPTSLEEIQEKKDFILGRNSVRNYLVSDDAKETWVLLSLDPYEGGIDFATENIAPYAEEVIFSDEFTSDAYTFKPTGMSYSEMEEDKVTAKECLLRVCSGFIVMILCLALFVRSVRGIIVPLIATIGGISSVLGFSAYLGIVGDSNLITLPILLGMALSVGYSIHYINSFRMFFRQSGKRKDSVIKAIEETGWPILFTVITTVASLISFLFAGIGPIRWVGGISASIVLAVYIYVIILIPILLSFGKNKQPNPEQVKTGATKIDMKFYRFGGKVLDHKIMVCIISSAIMLISALGIFKIRVNMDYVEMMGNKIPYVARTLSMLDGKLGSMYDYNIVIEYEDTDEFKNPERMKKLESLEQYAGTLSLTKISSGTPRVQSVIRLIKELYRTLNYDKEEFYSIPEEEDMLTQLMFLYEISDSKSLFNWIDPDYKMAYIHTELSKYDSNSIMSDLNNVKARAIELFPDAKVSIVGEVVNYAEMNGKLVKGELKSFVGSFIIIAILLMIAFASIRTGLIGMIPNIAPVLIIGGIMGYCSFYLDMLTMTIMPMILGIAVDDTIHFTNHIKFQLEKGYSFREAITVSFREIGKTMGMTTFILCAMFFMYTFSPMACLYRVGLLAILGLGSALIADYTITPALMYIVKPFSNMKIKEED